MRPLTLVLLFSLWGCSESVSGLAGGNVADSGSPDSGAVPDLDGGAPDAGGPLTCGDFDVDLDARNRSQLTRLGFALSTVVLQGRMRAPELRGDRLQASMQIGSVGRGHAGLVGLEVLVEPDAAFAAAQQFPLDVVVGFSSSQLPVLGDGPPSLGGPLAMVPVQDSAAPTELLGYPTEGAPFVAEVSVVGQPDSRLELRVHEVLAGEIPDTLLVNRSSSLVDPYPMPSNERFLVSFSHVSFNEPSDTWLGSVVDWRASSASHRAMIQSALASPRRDYDATAIEAFAEDYKTGWIYHRAPEVVAGSLTGFVDECCTGAGGTYVQYMLQHNFRNPLSRQSFQMGGHAYYPEEECGDGRIFAAGELQGPIEGSAFSCERDQAWESYVETTPIFAMREDTPESRAQVDGWVQAEGPLLRAYANDVELGPDDVAQLGPNAPWSKPLDVRSGLAGAELAWFRVTSMARRSDGYRVRVETTLSPYTFDHIERVQVQMDFECADPRLLEVGRVGLMPFVVDRRWLSQPDALPELFFVPGLIFDADGPAAAIASEFARQLRTQTSP